MKCTDGFESERYRKQLLRRNDVITLISTYSKKYPSIPDKNSGSFWDKRFSEKNKEVHFMEEDRIKLIVNTVKKTERILDLGVGKGKIENLLYKKYKKNISLYATDITDKTLKDLREKYPFWNFSNQKLEKLKFENNFFDRILLLEVLEHISPSNTFKILREINRILNINGEFVISVPINEKLEEMFPSNPNSHLRVYSEDLLMFELDYCGFDVVKVIRLTAFSKFYSFKKFLNKIFNLRESNNLIFICQKKA